MPRLLLPLLFVALLTAQATHARVPGGLRQKAAAFEASVNAIHRQVQHGGKDLGNQFRSKDNPNGLHSSDLRFAVDKARLAVDGVKRGAPMDRYIHRAVDLLGLSREGLQAFTSYHFSRNDGKRIEAVLQSAQNPNGVMSRSGARLANSVYEVKFWQRYGDKNKARSAMSRATAQARRLGVDLKRLLAVPVEVQPNFRRFRFNPGQGDTSKPLALRGDRLPTSQHQWWTGAKQANMDLVYRKLPRLIMSRYQQSKGKGKGKNGATTLRIWHVGFEDTSQTFFLAAAVDEAVARLRRSNPEMRTFLDTLRVDIHATDHMQRPKRRGRVVRFSETDVEQSAKAPLVLGEFGRSQVGQAKREIAALERGITSVPDKPRVELMEKLANAGKVGQLMGRMLRLTPRLKIKGERGGAQVEFTYRIKNRSWRIEDRINGEVVNGRADGRRRIRFVQSDLTRESAGARHSMDLVVATHVLPYIKLYGGDQGKFGDALKNISRSMRRGGVLLTDGWSTHYLIKREQPRWLKLMERTDREVVVATPEKLEPLRSSSRR